MKSSVHPTYKSKYRVGDWRAYERSLVQRDDVTLWLSADARDAWRPSPSGQPPVGSSDVRISRSRPRSLRLVFRLPLRQAEGFVRSVLSSMDVDLETPDHTTLSRRSGHLDVELRRVPATGPIHIIVDRTALSIVGESEWASAKRGRHGTRGWNKLHLAVNRSGMIIAHALTAVYADDAIAGIDLIAAVDGDLANVAGDAVYDTIAFYEAAGARGAPVVVPPPNTASVSRQKPPWRRSRSHCQEDEAARTSTMEDGVGLLSPGACGNAFFRYKSIIGEALRARNPGGQGAALLACNVLNQMTEWRTTVVPHRPVRRLSVGSL